MSTVRGCPPRLCCLAGGIRGVTIAHCSSVRSEGYSFLGRSCLNMAAHSSADRICANYLINLLFCQAKFPDSLLVRLPANFTFPNHSHASDELYVWMQGDFTYIAEDGTATPLSRHAYISLPGNVPHALKCGKTPCVFY